MLQKYISALLLSCGLLGCVMLAAPRAGSAGDPQGRRRSEGQRLKCLRECNQNYNSNVAACQNRARDQRKTCQAEAYERLIQCRANCPPR